MKDNINQMDMSLGGGLISEKIRINTINHPILIIGLGGTGIDALLRLKYQINRRFRLPESSSTNGSSAKARKHKPDNIEFLAFETNEHDRKRYKGIGLDTQSELVLLSNASIGSILNNRSTIPDYISSWLSPELTITDGTKGASGNRQAGRLLLFEKINTVIDAIDSKIRELRVDQENKLLVFILSGISGGTGGGSFLDIPYIVRGLIERDFGSRGIDKVEISGYLFTPDIHLSTNTLNIHTEEYIQRNGYASLKELDFFMNIEERGERFHQRYGTRLEVNSPLPPFNLCHLISATNVDGVFIKGAYDYCMNVTAENIVNFLAQEEKEIGSSGHGEEFAVSDYLSNLISNIATMESNLPSELKTGANFVYNIIGASAAVLPTEEISAYLAYCLFREISRIFDAVPDEPELDDFARAAKIDLDTVGNVLSERVPSIRLDYEGTDYYSYNNVIKTRRVDVDEKLADLYAQAKRGLADIRRVFPGELIESIKSEMTEVFLDPKKGPVYASALISPHMLQRIDSYSQRLRDTMSRMADGIKNLEIECDDRYNEARKAILGQEKKKNNYIESKVNLYRARFRCDCLEELLNIYRDVRNALEQENDNIYNIYVEILHEINNILGKNTQKVVLEDAKTYDWNIIEVSNVKQDINELVSSIGIEDLIREFAKALVSESHKWLNENELDIVGSLSDFIYDQFSAVLAKSMEEYLKAVHSKVNITDQAVRQIVQDEIAPQLYKDARPVFHLDNSAGMFTFPSYGIVSVPNNSPEILRGINAYRQSSLASLKFNIRRSSITNRVFWLNTQNGIPLFAYAPIRVYEELYEKTINTKEGIGRHLVMNESESWVDLPSPIPETLWGDTYRNLRQKAYNDKARQIYELALNNGSIIEQDGRRMCLLTENFRYTPDESPEDLLSIIKSLKTLKKVRENGMQVVDIKPVTDATSLIRNPKLLKLVEEENKKYGNIDELISELGSAKTKQEKSQRNESDFIRILVGGAIVKKGASFVFNKSIEEDPWDPFVNLMDHPDYPEYMAFIKYKDLNDLKKEILEKKARANEEAYSDDKLMEMLIKWQNTFATRKDAIDSDRWNYENGEDMYSFYKNGLIKLNGHINALKD